MIFKSTHPIIWFDIYSVDHLLESIIKMNFIWTYSARSSINFIHAYSMLNWLSAFSTDWQHWFIMDNCVTFFCSKIMRYSSKNQTKLLLQLFGFENIFPTSLKLHKFNKEGNPLNWINSNVKWNTHVYMSIHHSETQAWLPVWTKAKICTVHCLIFTVFVRDNW